MSFEVTLKDLNSALEEAKADMLGVRLLKHFHDNGLLTDDQLTGIVISEIISAFQGWRAGFTEAHSRGSLIEHNWLRAKNAVRYDSTTGFYDIEPERCLNAMTELSTKFLNLQVAGDYDRAKAFMDQWSSVPAELPEVLERLSDIPMLVSPVWDMSELQ